VSENVHSSDEEDLSAEPHLMQPQDGLSRQQVKRPAATRKNKRFGDQLHNTQA